MRIMLNLCHMLNRLFHLLILTVGHVVAIIVQVVTIMTVRDYNLYFYPVS